MTGSYRVNLPDGRIQTVTYRAGGTGGNVVELSYEGEAIYPDEVPAAPKKSVDAYPVPARAAYKPAAPAYQAPRYQPAPKYDAPKYEAAPAQYDAPAEY